MAEKQRVLMCGDVDGHFKFLFSKVENVNKKNGPFDFLFCVGNFFGDNNDELLPFKNGTKKIAIPTYIIGPNVESHEKLYPEEECSEVCPNLTFLGKRGLYTSSSGLKIAYISGKESKGESTGCTFDKNDVISVRNACLRGQPSFRGIDILLTSPWPENITNLDPAKPDFKYEGSKLISWLATHIKPRYHVCAMENIHYERPPYRNHSQSSDNIEIATRFIALAKVGNSNGKKWLYALNLSPVDRTRLSDLGQKTTDETVNPYPKSMLSSDPSGALKKEPKTTQFFYDMDSKDDHNKRKIGKNNDKPMKKRKFEFDQEKCWFCLSSAKVSQHLVISVGKKVYLALAKGGIVDDHFLILPVAHHQNSASLPDDVAQEMQAYKEAVAKYYSATDRVPVFFDRNFKSSHCQVQAVPIPKQKANLLKETFLLFAKQNNFKLMELSKKTELKQIAPEGTLYFYAELPDGEKLFHRIKKDFPLQFGREVLVSSQILNCKHRVDWRDCLLQDEGETELSNRIRKDFAKFDPDTDSDLLL